MSQITLRNLPESVDRAIRKRAQEKHISLNQSATELLQLTRDEHFKHVPMLRLQA